MLSLSELITKLKMLSLIYDFEIAEFISAIFIADIFIRKINGHKNRKIQKWPIYRTKKNKKKQKNVFIDLTLVDEYLRMTIAGVTIVQV